MKVDLSPIKESYLSYWKEGDPVAMTIYVKDGNAELIIFYGDLSLEYKFELLYGFLDDITDFYIKPKTLEDLISIFKDKGVVFEERIRYVVDTLGVVTLSRNGCMSKVAFKTEIYLEIRKSKSKLDLFPPTFMRELREAYLDCAKRAFENERKGCRVVNAYVTEHSFKD